DDPKAEAYAKEKAQAAQFGAPAKARGLEGVRVVIDAGHGGRDTGTLHDDVWESTYVYDVACRLRALLLERTRADVVLITKSAAKGFAVQELDVLPNTKDRVLLTDPPYALDDPVLGVNLRWYLANSILKRPGPDKKKIPPEKTVFLSIHADSLHPSVRGAMVYIPGERFLRDRFGKRGGVYASYKEYREQPTVSFNGRERIVSEGVSETLAERLLGAMRKADLPVHLFSPVRTHVVRGGGEWVPAVLRYNRIPNRVLLEIANLANVDDRALVKTRKFRHEMAESIVTGLLDFFGDAEKESPATRTTASP
ncbi:MAG: N-acetylmuramoyl-L-alanine amidase, partial [Acidobacteria bacterium]|nr:N-acetylmuramoyl-L-alanine amidase [Acidobacteriota bacterium]